MGNIQKDCGEIDWQLFFKKCEECGSDFRSPSQSDQVFQIALERAEQSYRDMAVTFKEGEKEYSRLANLIHGMGLCGNSELMNWTLEKMNIALTEREKIAIEILSSIDWQIVK